MREETSNDIEVYARPSALCKYNLRVAIVVIEFKSMPEKRSMNVCYAIKLSL